MKSLTVKTLVLSALLVGISYSADATCAYDTSKVSGAASWNYLKVGADWECGACKTNNG